ncbi:MAG: hypothetical protein OEM52_09605 [bacterium]|nr:hypothetical protein [bacterium]
MQSNRWFPVVCLFVLIPVLLTPLAYAQNVISLPLDHWLTPVLERWAIAGYAPNLSLTVQPYTRWEAALAVHNLIKTTTERGVKLSPGDLAFHDLASRELRDELRILKNSEDDNAGFLGSIVKKAKDYLGLSEVVNARSMRLRIEPEFSLRDVSSSDETSLRMKSIFAIETTPLPTVGLSMGLGKHVDYYRKESKWKEGGTRLQDTYVRFGVSNASVTFGAEERRWGVPGSNRLLMNGNDVAIPAFVINAQSSRLRIQMMWGQLEDFEYFDYYSDDYRQLKRSIIIKRFEYRSDNEWGIGVTNATIVLHNQGLDWQYWLPIPTILTTTNSNPNRYRANEIGVVDGWLRVSPRTLLTGELLFNQWSDFELQDFEILYDKSKNSFKDNYGVRVGCTSIEPFSMSGMTYRLQYTDIGPKTYSTFIDHNLITSNLQNSSGTMYRYRTTPIGHPYWNGFSNYEVEIEYVTKRAETVSVHCGYLRNDTPAMNRYIDMGDTSLGYTLLHRTNIGLKVQLIPNENSQISLFADTYHADNGSGSSGNLDWNEFGLSAKFNFHTLLKR